MDVQIQNLIPHTAKQNDNSRKQIYNFTPFWLSQSPVLPVTNVNAIYLRNNISNIHRFLTYDKYYHVY